MDTRRLTFFAGHLLAWGGENQRSFPWRHESDPFKVLVAEVLLQRSRSGTVGKVYSELFRRWKTADQLSRATVPAIQSVIRPLGLIRRAAILKRLAEKVATRGEVPRSVDELKELPGVGLYAANATLTVAYGLPNPAVDSVSARVYRRFFGLGEVPDVSSDTLLWEVVRSVSAAGRVKELNWAALDLAASVCLPKVPR